MFDTVRALAYYDGMDWAKRQYDYPVIDQAGRTLISRSSTPDDIRQAITVINNWRACHQFPLNTMQMRLRGKVDELNDKKARVSARIKRLPAIESKLRRLRNVTLVDMQDIGGCRAVVSSLDDVYKLAETYKGGWARHTLERERDYIKEPSKDGYRSLHLIYQYYSDRNSVYNCQRIEVQLRSMRQHAWATAVEAVDAFASQLLKINQGDANWERFFVLMSRCIATREGIGAPETSKQLTEELHDLARRLSVEERLLAIRASAEHVSRLPRNKRAYFYLIDLDIDKRRLKIIPYGKGQAQEASTKLAELELQYRGQVAKGIHKDVLLASVSSIAELKRAYPNYYADTELFLVELRHALK